MTYTVALINVIFIPPKDVTVFTNDFPIDQDSQMEKMVADLVGWSPPQSADRKKKKNL